MSRGYTYIPSENKTLSVQNCMKAVYTQKFPVLRMEILPAATS